MSEEEDYQCDDDGESEEIAEEMAVSKKLQPTKEDRLWTVKTLAEELISILGGRMTDEEKIFKEFLGVTMQDSESLIVNFPPYQKSQAIYSLNKFIEKNCDIKFKRNYDEELIPIVFERIKVSRIKTEIFMSQGYFFVEWKRVKLIVELFFGGSTMMYRIRFRKEDISKARELDRLFSRFMQNNNLLKGEKLVLKGRGYIDFLEYPELEWSDVILPEEIMEDFKLNILFPLKNKKRVKSKGLPWRRGLMLGGKAGTGKTQVCRVLCNELPKGVTLIWSTPKALYNEEMIQYLFKAARYFSPTLIIIEDIDFIGTSRNFVQNPILGELLTQLDGNDPNDGVFVIATTNRPEQLDEALANRPSRFDVQIKFELPNVETRKELIKLFTKDMTFDGPINLNYITTQTKGLTGSHIKELFIYCQLQALKRNEGGKVLMSDVTKRLNYYKKLMKTKELTI